MTNTNGATASNAAKLREALEQIANLLDRILVRTELDDEIHRIALEAQNMADGVLLLSPRNCDMGTVADQARRYRAFCKRHRVCDECYSELNGEKLDCEFAWAQLPYKGENEK